MPSEFVALIQDLKTQQQHVAGLELLRCITHVTGITLSDAEMQPNMHSGILFMPQRKRMA